MILAPLDSPRNGESIDTTATLPLLLIKARVVSKTPAQKKAKKIKTANFFFLQMHKKRCKRLSSQPPALIFAPK
jgi:hypothetical protein